MGFTDYFASPFRWAEVDRLSSQIRRAYRPWRKPWRSGFDSRHGVPPFDHATCPSEFAEPPLVPHSAQNRTHIVTHMMRCLVASTVVQPRENTQSDLGDVGSIPIGRAFSTGR